MKLFSNKRLIQKVMLSIFLPVLPTAMASVIVFNIWGMKPVFIQLFIMGYFALSAYVYIIVNSIFSSRYRKRCLSEKDVSKLDDEGKAIVQYFLEKHGTPITESKFDSTVKSMNLRKLRMKMKAKRLEAVSSQKKACE